MNKLPKNIYVDEESGEPIWFTSAEECAISGQVRVVGVYQLKAKVEVTTQIKQEIVVKKQSRKANQPEQPIPVELSEAIPSEPSEVAAGETISSTVQS